jgi:O-antigen/teichoic acid export membrane protein
MLIKFAAVIRTSGHLSNRVHEASNRYSLISFKFATFGAISSVLMVADNFLVFGLLGLGDLGYYGIAFAIVTLVVNIFGTTLQRQEFLTNVGGKPKTSVRFLFGAVFSGTLLSLSVVAMGNLFLIQNLMASGFLALFLCLGVPFRIRNLHVSVIIEKFGTFKERIISLILSITILSGLNLLGIFIYDLVGLCVASSFSYFLIGAINSSLAEKVSARVAKSQ